MLLTPLPLSQTVTLSRTPSPSSVTYFMDGPLGNLPIYTAKYVRLLTSNLILRPLFDLRPGTAALLCPIVTPLVLLESTSKS